MLLRLEKSVKDWLGKQNQTLPPI